MSEREDPSSLEEALVQLYEERRHKNALAAGQAGVTHAMALLQAETREQAARLEVAYRELDEARAERDRQKARANGLNALLERDPAGLVWLREGVIADLHAAGWPEELPAELVQQRDEARATIAAWEAKAGALLGSDFQAGTVEAALDYAAGLATLIEPHAIRTRADVEARLDAVLRGPDFERTVPRLARAAWAFVRDFGAEMEDKTALVDLVCAVLGVPHAGCDWPDDGRSTEVDDAG